MSELKTTTSDIAHQLNELLKKVNVEKPKAEDVRALTQFMREHRNAWRVCGDLIAQAQYGLIDSIQAGRGSKEAMTFGMYELYKELRKPGDGELENLLIDQVVLNWLRVGVAECQYNNRLGGSFTTEAGNFWDKHLSRAQARYLKSIEALARVRKLSRPGAIQLNIGERQVNITQEGKKKIAAPAAEMKDVTGANSNKPEGAKGDQK